MTFERKLVGAAFIATLMGRTSALERVFLERETAYWPETESPALSVYVRDERNQKLSADPLTYERSLEVWVDLFVRDTQGELLMVLAHELSKQVEDLLHPVLFQGFPGLPITVDHERRVSSPRSTTRTRRESASTPACVRPGKSSTTPSTRPTGPLRATT